MPVNKATSQESFDLIKGIARIISETNGLSLQDTLELASNTNCIIKHPTTRKHIIDFNHQLTMYHLNKTSMESLLDHPVAQALHQFFQLFPLKYREAHIHLTGSLKADFIFPYLEKLFTGPNANKYQPIIERLYGKDAFPIANVKALDKMLRLKDAGKIDDAGHKEPIDKSQHSTFMNRFNRYLQILTIPKFILTTEEIHIDAAYNMAKDLYQNYNVGHIQLKFTLSRASSNNEDVIPGIENLSMEKVVLGLFSGFMRFKKEHPDFDFMLSPSFRKEADFFDNKRFASKEEDFLAQVNGILTIIKKYPEIAPYLKEVDTVGNEKNLFRKAHFLQMQYGFQKLRENGFRIRSHHGETWHTLRLGVQAVDNSLNIWHIDTLEHGISLGLNPNYYFHSLFDRVLIWNHKNLALSPNWLETKEILDMDWHQHESIQAKLIAGTCLSSKEIEIFAKVKYRTAKEVEHYQHDVLNRMISKKVTLTSLPSSNIKLIERLPDYKDHPFSWWEKKGVQQSVGTDNYITLNTNFIKEMLILLLSDPKHLKITKLLMVTTGEDRRSYIAKLLWDMRNKIEKTKTNQK